MYTRSLLRREEYRALSGMELAGDVLDVGGSKKSGYHELFTGTHRITTANIDPAYDVDVVFDAEATWPIADASYDAVLFVNVLEHLYGYRDAVREAHRVLRANGRVVGVVPFMFNVHGSPSDYFRFTKSALERIFADAGFKSVEVRELGTGAASVAYHAFIGFARWKWLARLGIGVARALDGLMRFVRPRHKMSAEYMPLGYFFVAQKP